MRILDRYITFSITKIFLSTVLVFCFLYVLIDTTGKLDEFIDREVPLSIIVQFYSYSIPIILVEIAPISCLIAILFTFSRMHNNNEVIAIRSSGQNFWQITKSAIMFGLLISAIVFFLSENYVPQASQQTKKIKNENLMLYVDRLRLQNQIVDNLTFYGLKNRLYYIGSFHMGTNELNDITIVEYDEQQNIKQKIVALKGKWTGLAWKFFDAQITTFGTGGANDPQRIKFYKDKLMDIKETPEDFLKQRLNVETMNIRALSSYIGRFENSGAAKAINNLRVDFHKKFADPFITFVLVLVGLAFALIVRSRKGMTLISLGIGLCLGFMHYVINSLMLAFGKGGLFPPIVSAWASSFIFVVLALVLIRFKF